MLIKDRDFGFPLHRLNGPGRDAWEAGPVTQRILTKGLNRLYPNQRVGVVTPQPMYLVAVVSPRGAIEQCPRPYQIIEFWEIANKPSPVGCFCQDFVDHESHMPWRDRCNLYGTVKHHPFCQYEHVARANFMQVAHLGMAQRPDNWENNRQALRKQAGLD